MVSDAGNDGGVQFLSVRVRKVIQSIKEIVGTGSHSEAEIYAALKESNMDPNETIQTLINQEPFHEVKRKKDKKKENTGGGCKNFADANRHNGHAGPGMKVNTYLDRNNQRGYTEITSAGVNREFRFHKDKRAYPKFSGEPKPLLPNASGAHVRLQVSEKSSLAGNLNNQKPLGGHFPSQTRVSSSAPIATPLKETSSTVIARKELPNKNSVPVQASAACVEVEKPIESSLNSTNHVSNNCEVGLHSFSLDPVHVPCSESSVNSSVGDIKREVGPIGVPSQLSENLDNLSAIKDISAGHSLSVSTETTEASPHFKRPGVIETPLKSNPSATTGMMKTVDKEADQLHDKTKEVDTKENSNVVFADHIRVAESNSTQLIFGSFGQNKEVSNDVLIFGSFGQNIEFSNASIYDSKNVKSGEEKAFTEVMYPPLQSISSSPAEVEVPDASESPAGKNIDDLRHEPDNEPTRLISQGSDSMNQQDSSTNLSTFSTFGEAHTGYSNPYFRPTVGDNVSSQGLQSHQEASPSSSMVMQQPLMTQMYPQVNVSHYGNLMSIRQLLSPVYVPPSTMTIPGFSNNPTSYPPQPSNGNNNYLLMLGGSSSHHQLAVSAANPVASFGNYANHPSGYSINPSSSAATGLDDLNHYVPNPQVERSEILIHQNSREVRGMRQPYYYNNMAGQLAGNGNYLPLQSGLPSLTQPSPSQLQLQFSDLYHQPLSQQHTTTTNLHHLLGNTAAAAATPGAQRGGGYQQLIRHFDGM